MPPVQARVSDFDHKNLIRKQIRQAKCVAHHSNTFLGIALPRLANMQYHVFKRLMSCTDDAVIPNLVTSVCKIMEMQRVLLRMPGPGRVKDQDSKPVIDGHITSKTPTIQDIEELRRAVDVQDQQDVQDQPAPPQTD